MKDKARFICKILQDSNKQALFVGGCVRDMILNKEAHDIDICTDATPDEVLKILKQNKIFTKEVGKSFGVVLARIDDFEFEIATFRTEKGFSNGRHPDEVSFSKSPEEDASRRDLTINSIFLDPISNEFFDFFKGREDIENKIIRFVGKASERISEDKLRMLRAVRFAHKLGFKLDEESSDAIKRWSHTINNISPERIKSEIDKMFESKNPSEAVEIMREVGLLKEVLPEVEKLFDHPHSKKWHAEAPDIWGHVKKVMDEVKERSDEVIDVWAAMFHDIGKPSTAFKKEDGDLSFKRHDEVGSEIVSSISNRLRFSSEEEEIMKDVCFHHMNVKAAHVMKKSKIRRLMSEKNFNKIKLISFVDSLICIQAPGFEEDATIWFSAFDNISSEVDVIMPKPFLTGKHLISFGMKPGPEFKDILENCMTMQLDGEINSEEEAIEWFKKM